MNAWSWLLGGIAVAGLCASLIAAPFAILQTLRRRQMPLLEDVDRVDADWRDTEAGIDLELTTGHEELDMDPVQRRRAIDACKALFAADWEGSDR